MPCMLRITTREADHGAHAARDADSVRRARRTPTDVRSDAFARAFARDLHGQQGEQPEVALRLRAVTSCLGAGRPSRLRRAAWPRSADSARSEAFLTNDRALCYLMACRVPMITLLAQPSAQHGKPPEHTLLGVSVFFGPNQNRSAPSRPLVSDRWDML